MAWWDGIIEGYKNLYSGKNPFEGVSLDPTKSSAFTGAGLPWGEGPMDPYKPQYKAFNPNDYQGLDTSALGSALRQDIGRSTARSKGRLQASLQRGGGGGADAISGLAQLEGEQGMQENILNAKLAQQDWENKWRQYENQMEIERYKAGEDLKRYEQEKGRKDAPMDFLGGIAGTGLGYLTGGLAGGLGANLAKDWFGSGEPKTPSKK